MSDQPSGDWLPEYPSCLLPDDDTAVERLAAALHDPVVQTKVHAYSFPISEQAAAIIAALRDGGQR